MRDLRKTGLISAAVAGVMWVVVVASFLIPVGEGVNIGAALLAIVAVGVSILAAVLLMVAVDDLAVRVVGVVSVASWGFFFAATPMNETEDVRQLAVAGVAVVALGICALLAQRKGRRVH